AITRFPWRLSMPRTKKGTPPQYREHKPTGQAYLRLPLGDGIYKFIYLGPYGSPESRTEYARIIASWQEKPGDLPAVLNPDITISELIHAFLSGAQNRYSESGRESKNFSLS